ncbi:hypothetical protein LNKW23_28190 [Paralimibaculum aggregatum]|uniref:CAAX prenyl protease 2/Lysostaphin resistance protein A-like domain-containing protein n=1 Tax=Paralimibaculum aggregatum TaxID=3036245 RepID=A0ABQ6LMD3_9RHOB|nr:type II CAAX endopeptidase family protein [Limibaculum sp. NKW23]GMG83606.1 hypothetical protein LNKW23_28190 [Limibaculum sp. NKW23]
MTPVAAPAADPAGAAFRHYLDMAAGRPGSWRPAVGVLAVLAGWLIVGTVLSAATGGLALRGGSPAGVALLLGSFGGIWLGLAVALRALHGRGLASLWGGAAGRRWRGLALGAGIGAGLHAATALLALPLAGLPGRSALALADWAAWLPLLALGVALQAGAEEAVFRGYLVQEIGRRLRHPLAWAVLPSALFGALHYAPHLPGWSALAYVAVSFLFGLSASLLVWRFGGLAAAFGLHAAINFLGLTVAGLDGVAAGAQLWLYDAGRAEALLAADLVVSAALLGGLWWCLGPAASRRAAA